ncbi:chromate transporter [Niabella drilacis]|uniref:Chromate transporter, chromate ion transporter (CHR) family n=1 Tax=Niabella drilacis (strain DSM 25811 / CCM 8410 / CCUG 62505 / LMG 26954 / E90) TaxID=1285928 RepID=A0A1G6MVY6_NIADE|nr:chromate transporter [Niabella drilacis]SDC59156.1 chromate transporter, chromate ion transporter (CHR) family [Niabella drilacis]
MAAVKDNTRTKALKEIAGISLKLGSTGFGGIAGVVAAIEQEVVVRRRWIDHQHFMDVLSACYIVPGPNAVEIMMHCGKERGGRPGLVVAGVCYILPATIICLIFACCYQLYSEVPDVQPFISGIRPATTALVMGAVFRLAGNTLRKDRTLLLLCLFVFAGSLYGINEVLLILASGVLNCLIRLSKNRLSLFAATFPPGGYGQQAAVGRIRLRLEPLCVGCYFRNDRI